MGWLLIGSLTAKYKETNLTLAYQIDSDFRFRSKRASVEVVSLENEKKIDLEFREVEWYVGGTKRGDLEMCTDVDLELTPSTNTLPIRRNSVGIGEKIETMAAWIRVPSLKVEPVRQSYERVSQSEYIYMSGNFHAKLEVNEVGLVTNYEGIWEEC